MSAFVDKVKLLQGEIARLRTERGDYISGTRALEQGARLPDVVADLDKQILDLTVEIVRLGGPVP